MKINEAKYLISCPSIDLCPPPDKPEYAFIGRSNVGKSSLINMLTNHSKLAKTSAKPGKTQLINHFIINNTWYLVDLPGYGYAKTSKSNREQWDVMIRQYLSQRENLYCVFVLIDSNIPPQKIDLEFLMWLGESEIPFAIVFTKADRLSVNKMQSHLAAYKKTLLQTWEIMPPYVITSSINNLGQEELLEYIEEINESSKES
jgi:GTP-binding protein